MQEEIRLDSAGRSKIEWYEHGPGPAGYALPSVFGKPNHAVTHRINPEYSMGIRLPYTFLRNSCSPGPAAYCIPPGVKAKGKFTAPKYSLIPRRPERRGMLNPGPAGYYIPKPDIIRTKGPVYTLRIRPPILSVKPSPAPNHYSLPPLIGPNVANKPSSAVVEMKGNRDCKLIPKSPGPIYDIGRPDVVKSKAPAYTMRIKWADMSENQKFEAGPASYDCSRKICLCKPGCHLGIRYNQFTGVMRTACEKSHNDPISSD